MISTHVLDVENGTPAAGVQVEVLRGDELVGRHETDADGRIAKLADEPGEYRLVFHPGGGFFQRVEVIFTAEPGRHYHVPLLMAPYACTIYRGS